MKKVRMELHFTEEEMRQIGQIARLAGRSRKNFCEFTLREVIAAPRAIEGLQRKESKQRKEKEPKRKEIEFDQVPAKRATERLDLLDTTRLVTNTSTSTISEVTKKKSESQAPKKTNYVPVYRGPERTYLESMGYVWDRPDNSAIKNLKEKILKIHKRDNLPTDDDILLLAFKALIDNLPAWVRQNKFSLSYINRTFNEIYQHAKGKSGNPNRVGLSKTDRDTLTRIIRDS